jgi:hypothetical protein
MRDPAVEAIKELSGLSVAVGLPSSGGCSFQRACSLTEYAIYPGSFSPEQYMSLTVCSVRTAWVCQFPYAA